MARPTLSHFKRPSVTPELFSRSRWWRGSGRSCRSSAPAFGLHQLLWPPALRQWCSSHAQVRACSPPLPRRCLRHSNGSATCVSVEHCATPFVLNRLFWRVVLHASMQVSLTLGCRHTHVVFCAVEDSSCSQPCLNTGSMSLSACSCIVLATFISFCGLN